MKVPEVKSYKYSNSKLKDLVRSYRRIIRRK